MGLLAAAGTILMAAKPSAKDEPGAAFAISLATLPKPYATPAVANSSVTIPRPDNAVLQVPKGFTASLFASHLSSPRWLAVAANGDVFLSEPRDGKVTLLRDSNHDGKAEMVTTFTSGFDRPHGLAFHDGFLYVADVNAVWRIPYKDGATQAGLRQRVTQQSFGGDGDHWSRNIAFDSKGGLYLAIGSGANVEEGEPPTLASVQKVNADGTLSPFATGLRNPVGIAFYPGSDNLFVTVNERDGLGDDLVPDYLTHIRQGDFFGWPYAYIGAHPDPTFGSKRPDLVAKTKTPDLLFQAHSASLGLVFYEGTQFPADYKGDAFVALHGSWNRATPTGYKVVRVKFKDGKPISGYEDFATGFWDGMSSPAKVWGRPVGLAIAKDGSLLIADDAGKAVWRVSYTGGK
jgi:glucose/arabinose dehydrogenase